MSEQKNKFWDLIDGDLTPEQKEALEKNLETSAQAKQEQQQRLQLHASLQKMEAEQPSMRFAQNIMEKLPQLYQKIKVQPLISKRSLQILTASFTAFVAWYLYTAVSVLGDQPRTANNTAADRIIEFLNSTSNQTLMMVMIVSAGLLALFALDRLMKSYFQKNNRLSSDKS